jgi:hypothetical protein
VNYYKKFEKNQTDNDLAEKIGLLFNCIVQGSYKPINRNSDLVMVKDRLSNVSFQRDSQLDSKQINNMNVMLRKWNESIKAMHKRLMVHIFKDQISSNQPQTSHWNYIPDKSPRQKSVTQPTWDDSGNDMREHCSVSKPRNKEWYLTANHNLLMYFGKLHENPTDRDLIEKIGLLFNCIVQQNYRPIRSESTIETIRKNLRGSKFEDDSQLESHIIELMRVLFSHWREHYNKAHN